MRRVLWLVMAVALLGLGGWRIEDAFPSIAVVVGSGFHCTTFSVGVTRWLTEAHCLDPKQPLRILGTEVTVITHSDEVDLALLQGPIAPPLTIAKHEPELGDVVLMIGWPVEWRQHRPLLWWGQVQAKDIVVGIEDWPAHAMNMIQHGGGPGMSGGPILNANHEVVGITEAISEYPGLSSGTPTVKEIRTFLGMK